MATTILTWLFVFLYVLVLALLVLLVVRALRPARTARTQSQAPLAQDLEPPMPPPPLLMAHGLGRSYVDRDGITIPVLEDVSLAIAAGEVVAVVGPSGGGKSTLLNLLAGLDVPATGGIVFRGVPLPGREGEVLRVHREVHVSLVFQDHNLLSFQTAMENAALPLLIRGWPRRAALATARQALERLGMGELCYRFPHQLSGGQQQRVAIARAFVSPAPLILADEPTGSLDLENAERVMSAFVAAARLLGRAVLLVTHNPDLAAHHCDRVLRCADRTVRPVVVVRPEAPREAVMS